MTSFRLDPPLTRTGGDGPARRVSEGFYASKSMSGHPRVPNFAKSGGS